MSYLPDNPIINLLSLDRTGTLMLAAIALTLLDFLALNYLYKKKKLSRKEYYFFSLGMGILNFLIFALIDRIICCLY
jgi:hypothetical protein